jgi:ATP-dependent RNA helicase RhlE
VSRFTDFQLLPSLLATLQEQGLIEPTEIQASTLSALLQGNGVVGVAQTGSGKTLAYALPMLHRLKTLENEGSSVERPARPRGLIIVPGRELGEQVGKVFKGLTHDTRLRVRTVLGGTTAQIARQNVNGPLEILVATPGRLEQLLTSGPLRLDDVRMVVLDEADQLLDPGFLAGVQRIVDRCAKGTQLAMFSATLPQLLDPIVNAFFDTPPLRVRTRGSQQVVATLRTDNLKVNDGHRFGVLATVLAEAPTVGTLLFANTRDQCDRIAAWLESEAIPYTTYMGQMDRLERRANLARFRKGEVSVLLTTDLGGRGLDIERVDRVVNVHLPSDIDNYMHRVGRTARAGRAGQVVNLVTGRDVPLMTKLQRRAASAKDRPPA